MSVRPITAGPASVGALTASGGTQTGLAVLTVSRKLASAEPPEFVAITVTVSTRAVSVIRVTTPVAGLIVAAAPVTAKRRPSPAKAAAAATLAAAAPCSTVTSASMSTAIGAGQLTRIAAGSAESEPATLLAVTWQVISRPSSAATGR